MQQYIKYMVIVTLVSFFIILLLCLTFMFPVYALLVFGYLTIWIISAMLVSINTGKSDNGY